MKSFKLSKLSNLLKSIKIPKLKLPKLPKLPKLKLEKLKLEKPIKFSKPDFKNLKGNTRSLFKNLKIKYKLGAGFLVIITLSLIVTIISISDMKKIQNNSKNMYDSMLTPIQILGKLQSDIEYERSEYLNIMVDRDYANYHLTYIKGKISQDESLLSDYSKIEKSEISNAAFESFKKSYDYYEKSLEGIDSLVEQKNFNELGKMIENIDVNGKIAVQNLDVLISLYKDEANSENNQNASIFQASYSKIVTIFILVLISSFLIGIYLMTLINKSLSKLKQSADAMSQGDINIDLIKTDRKDEIGQLYSAFSMMVDNIKQHALVARSIANGDFDVNINVKSEKDVLGIELSSMTATIKNIIENINGLIRNIEKGNLDVRLDTSVYNGGWKELTEGINKLIETFINPLNMTALYIDKISSGHIPEKITETYYGDFNNIKNNFNSCIDVMNGLIADTNNLIASVEEGNLDERADESSYSGDWGKLLNKINVLVEAFNSPIKYASEYLEQLSQGIDPGEAADDFNGDFKVITNNLTHVRNSFTELYKQTIGLIEEAKKGNLSYRADSKNLRGSYVHIVEGINQTLDEILKPLKGSMALLGEIAKGNLNAELEGDYNGDYAAIKNEMNNMMLILKNIILEVSRVLNELSKGNLNISIDTRYSGDFGSISDSINSIIKSLNRAFRDIETVSYQVASGSAQVSDSAMALSQGASTQASSIEEITAAITEVAAQTNENAANAKMANEAAMDARKHADEGKTDVADMLKAMDEIQSSSDNISRIIKVIDDIAFQTNILALNAAVEAARAGQQGKGFAVVADEVRNLAARSADAAKETEKLIEESITKSNKGKKIAEKTSQVLFGIAKKIETASDISSNIAASANEQAAGIKQINQAIEEVSKVTQANTATSEESAAAAEELSNQAELLKDKLSQFKLKAESLNSKEIELNNEVLDNIKKILGNGNIDKASLLKLINR